MDKTDPARWEAFCRHTHHGERCDCYILRQAFDAGVAQERERCARIVETWAQDHLTVQPSFTRMAAALRAPSAPEPRGEIRPDLHPGCSPGMPSHYHGSAPTAPTPEAVERDDRWSRYRYLVGCLDPEQYVNIRADELCDLLRERDASRTVAAGQSALLHELNQAHGVAQALEQQLLHTPEAVERVARAFETADTHSDSPDGITVRIGCVDWNALRAAIAALQDNQQSNPEDLVQ